MVGHDAELKTELARTDHHRRHLDYYLIVSGPELRDCYGIVCIDDV